MPATIINSDRKISPMSWSKRILITLAAVVALMLIPVVGLIIFDFYVDAQVARFYNTHPMLRSMNEAPHPPITRPLTELDQARADILLKRLPIGSSRADALQVFSLEGMKCERPTGTAQQSMLVCYVTAPKVRWHIEVRFDDNDKVSGGRVLTLKATVE
jgi:hypothetical protein